MVRLIYDVDGYIKNFCILSKVICVVLFKVLCWEINRYIIQFELEEFLRRRFKLKVNEVEEYCNVIEYIILLFLCNIFQFYKNNLNFNNYFVLYDISIVFLKDVNEILILI